MSSRIRNAAVIASTAAMLSLAGAAFAEDGEVIVFDWAGYEDPAFHPDFVTKYGDSPSFAFFGDEDEAFEKLDYIDAARLQYGAGSKIDLVQAEACELGGNRVTWPGQEGGPNAPSLSAEAQVKACGLDLVGVEGMRRREMPVGEKLRNAEVWNNAGSVHADSLEKRLQGGLPGRPD